MQARTKFEKMVAASNMKLSAINPKAIAWAVKKRIVHPAFRTPSNVLTCGDCGHQFTLKGELGLITCPHCKGILSVEDTRKRKFERASYFSTLDVVDELQVQRVYLLTVSFKKGETLKVACVEVCRLWLDCKGHSALTSKRRSLGYYQDSFNWSSKIELRSMSETHIVISECYVYPRYKVIPALKRNGFDKCMLDVDCHTYLYMRALLRDPRIETLMKAGHIQLVKYFINNPTQLEKSWSSLKIAIRSNYVPSDMATWCDLLRLLEKFGCDVRSTKYICPDNLKGTHDYWLSKVTKLEEKRRKQEMLERALKREAEFYATKSIYFGIVFSDSEIEVSVLDSIEAYKEEGDAMHHCVFRCSYFDRPDSIILSAHDKSGNRIETVEFSITQSKVIQCHGHHNQDSDYHDRIINLVNSNAYRFIEAKERATA